MITGIADGFHRNTWWSRLLFAGLLLPASLIYPLSNQIAAAGGRAMVLKLPIDDVIPFCPPFILPYLCWHLLIVLTLAFLIFSRQTGHALHRLVLALVIADLVSGVIYLAVPTQMIRPVVTGGTWADHFVRLVQAADLPFNCFPSSHVSFAVILNRSLASAGPRHLVFRVANNTLTLLIIASTVLIKQHYTPDILGGLAVAGISLFCSARLWKKLSTGPTFAPSPEQAAD